MKGAAFALFFSACLAAQTGAIEGLVVQQGSNQPLAGVHVRLVQVDFDAINPSAGVPYGAISDKAGHFSISNMPAGNYQPMSDRNGYIYMPGNAGSARALLIAIKAGQKISDYRIEMAPVAIIAGRVLDEYGDPVANVMVVPEPVSTMNRSTIRNINASNDRGEFRMSLGAGKYYVQARPSTYQPMATGEIRTDGSSEASYGPTYFPNTASKERGVVIEAVAGRETSGVDIRLVRQKVLSVSGTVSGVPEGPNRAQVMLIRLEGGGSRGTTAGLDGRFSFPRAEPGKYRLSARFNDLESMLVDLDLEAGDVNGIELRLSAGEDLAGTFEVIGGAPDPERRWVVRLSGMTRSFNAQTDANGAFRVAGVTPGRYGVSVEALTEDAYVDSVQLNGAAVPDRNLDLSRGAGGSRVKVRVGRNGGRISGTVLDAQGNALKNAPVFVLLSNDPKALLQSAPLRAAADGSFTFKAIRPGQYRLFAVNVIDLSGNAEEALRSLYERAPEIEIHEGDRLTKDARVLSQEAVNAK